MEKLAEMLFQVDKGTGKPIPLTRKVSAFLKSQESRGFSGKRVELSVRGMRLASCNGCEGAKDRGDGRKVCGLCECGEGDGVVLDWGSERYGKLDFPYLECPLGKEGFSNEGDAWPGVKVGQGLDGFVEKAYVINLDGRQDRLKMFWDGLGKVGSDWPFPMPERWRGVNGRKVPLPYGWRAGSGAWGCMQSHRQILEKCILDGVECVAVFEDDAVFVDGFADKWKKFLAEVPDDWECLMIGGQHINQSKERPELVSVNVFRCKNAQRTHGYILRGQAIRDLYQEWVSTLGHCDHIMGPFLGARKKTYAPVEFLVVQGESKSDITGRNEPERAWKTGFESVELTLVLGSPEAVNGIRRKGLHFGNWRDEVGVDRGLNEVFKGGDFDRKKMVDWIGVLKWEAVAVGASVMIWHPAAGKWRKELEEMIPGLKVCDLEVANVSNSN